MTNQSPGQLQRTVVAVLVTPTRPADPQGAAGGRREGLPQRGRLLLHAGLRGVPVGAGGSRHHYRVADGQRHTARGRCRCESVQSRTELETVREAVGRVL